MWCLAVDVAAADAGVETTGVGVICFGVPSEAMGTPQSTKHAHSTRNGFRLGSVHPNGVRMIRFPGQATAYTEKQVQLDSVGPEIPARVSVT